MSNSIILGVGLGDNVSRDMDKLANKLRGKMRALSSVGQSMSMTLTLPIVAAGAALLKFTGDLDAMKKALAANMGGMKQANVEFEKLRELAKAPGIGFEEAVQGSYRLQGLGKSADQARTIMEGLAKAVALSGGGNAEFGGVMTQVAQMFGKGRVLQQDLKFMIENAPILSKVMKDVFGTIDTEEIQKKGISATQFIDGLIGGLKNMQGIGGSVKNSMENLWTSIKIGTGEIGLSIIGVTSWDKAIDGAADTVQRITGNINKWVQQHGILTKAILTAIAAMAVVGPITSLIANFGLLGSFAFAAGQKIYALIKGMVLLNTTAGTSAVKLGLIGAAMYGIGKAFDAVSGGQENVIANYFAEVKTQLEETGRVADRTKAALIAAAAIKVLTLQFGQADDLLKLARGEGVVPDKVTQIGQRGGRGSMNGAAWASNIANMPHATGGSGGGLTTEEKNAIEKKIEATNKYAREMQEMWAHNPVSNLPSSPDRQLGIIAAMKKIQPSGGVGSYINQSDVKVMDEYNAALRDIAINQTLGASQLDLMKDKLSAATEAYKGMVDAYGADSQQAADRLSQVEKYKQALDGLIAKEKEHTASLEQKNKVMGYAQTFVGGLVDGFIALATEGSKGFESFGKAILKAIGQIIKLIIVDSILLAIQSLLFPGLGLAKGAGAVSGLGGALKSIGALAMADGGVVSGETLIRAGEYPSASMGNPELVAPANKMMGFIRQAVSESGGGNGGQLTASIHGDQLLFLVSRAQNRANRRGSGNAIRM